jgi:hypothetical protein
MENNMEQGSPEYSPIIIENDISEKAVNQSYHQKKSLYGITREQFEELVTKQDHKCASCKEDARGFEHTLHVDHCHDSLEIRGLLCSGCNTAAGWLDNNPDTAEKLAEYLRNNGTGIFTNLQTKVVNE